MNFRTIILLLVIAVIAVFAALNWGALLTPMEMSLGMLTVQAPLGMIMLGLTVLLAIVFATYVVSLQGSVLLDTRRHAKEMQVQRELADKAEASRFTDLRTFLEAQHQQAQAALLGRLDLLETRLAARVQESGSSTAAYVGQLEHQMRARPDGSSAV